MAKILPSSFATASTQEGSTIETAVEIARGVVPGAALFKNAF